MRLSQSIEIEAPVRTVWDVVADPAKYVTFMSGVTRWECASEQRQGVGARYRMLMRVGSSEVGGLVEVVEWDELRNIAWTSVTGIDQRGRWRIRKQRGGVTRVEFRFAYGVAGGGITGWLAELVASRSINGRIGESLGRLKRLIEHEQLRAQTQERRRERRSALT